MSCITCGNRYTVVIEILRVSSITCGNRYTVVIEILRVSSITTASFARDIASGFWNGSMDA